MLERPEETRQERKSIQSQERKGVCGNQADTGQRVGGLRQRKGKSELNWNLVLGGPLPAAMFPT